jgi:hypothetical protein
LASGDSKDGGYGLYHYRRACFDDYLSAKDSGTLQVIDRNALSKLIECIEASKVVQTVDRRVARNVLDLQYSASRTNL